MEIKFKKLSDKAVTPIRTADSGAGYNLTAVRVTTEINERGQLLVVYHSDISVEIPEGYEGQLRPLNDICGKTLRMCGNSVIGSGYSNDIVGKFITTTDVVPAVYEENKYFAQLVINKVEDIELVEYIEEVSAPTDSQSLPETKDESTNFENSNGSGGTENSPEQV